MSLMGLFLLDCHNKKEEKGKVPSNRTQLKIIADVLKTSRDNSREEGVGVSIILRGANMSYVRLKALIGGLLESNLLEEITHEKEKKYRISIKGMSFLLHILILKNLQGHLA